MNAEIKKQWVEALRSGRFVQGTERLRSSTDTGPRHCCLGVLCELFTEATGDDWTRILTETENGRTVQVGYDESIETLPERVRRWSELDLCDPVVAAPFNGLTWLSLSERNDGGQTFATIADLIEAQL